MYTLNRACALPYLQGVPMNRIPAVMALNWIETANQSELNMAKRVIKARSKDLQEKTPKPQASHGGTEPALYGSEVMNGGGMD